MKQSAPFTASTAGLEVKAIEGERGPIKIQGYAANFDVDRQDEAFLPGAFERAWQNYLDTNPVILYHHKPDSPLGRITGGELRPQGLWVEGEIDPPVTGAWNEPIYNSISTGTTKGFSVGGIFHRTMTEAGPRIHDMDLGEISVTPFPVNRTTMFEVAGKAFDEPYEGATTAAERAAIAYIEKLESTIRYIAEAVDAETRELRNT